MEEAIQEQIIKELKSDKYPFEEKHWEQLKAKMHNDNGSKKVVLFAILLVGSLQLSVIFPFPSDSSNSSIKSKIEHSIMNEIDSLLPVDHFSPSENNMVSVELESSQKKNSTYSNSSQKMTLVLEPLKNPNSSLGEFKNVETKINNAELSLLSNKWRELSIYASPTLNDIGIEYRFGLSKSLFINTGINHFSSSVNYEAPSTSDETLEIEDNSYWAYQNTSEWEYTDSTLTAIGWQYTDSVYSISVDSTFNIQIDSSYISNNIPVQNIRVTINKISIPLMIGYRKQHGRFEYGLLLGGSIDFITKTRTLGMENPISTQHTQTNFSVRAGTYANYRLTSLLSAGVQPNFRYSIRPDIVINGIKKRSINYSLRAYLRLRF